VNVKSEERIQIDFISTPINIDDIEIDKIFNKEHRESLSYNDNNYGKGYGLYLCRLLLGLIGGSVSVDKISENVKFTIML
jgi:K+-sensing histidine kinase KdpD